MAVQGSTILGSPPRFRPDAAPAVLLQLTSAGHLTVDLLSWFPGVEILLVLVGKAPGPAHYINPEARAPEPAVGCRASPGQRCFEAR